MVASIEYVGSSVEPIVCEKVTLIALNTRKPANITPTVIRRTTGSPPPDDPLELDEPKSLLDDEPPQPPPDDEELPELLELPELVDP